MAFGSSAGKRGLPDTAGKLKFLFLKVFEFRCLNTNSADIHHNVSNSRAKRRAFKLWKWGGKEDTMA